MTKDCQKKKFLTAKNDRIFKAVFVDENNHGLMEALLEEILGEKVKIIKFLNNELEVREKQEREKRVDVLIEIEKMKVHVEIDSNATKSVRYRNLIYFEAFHSTITKKKDKYDMNVRYIHISLEFGIGRKHEIIDEYELQNKKGEKFVDNMKYILVNMDRLKKVWYTKSEEAREKYKYLMLIDLPKEELERYQEEDELVKEYKERIMFVNDKFDFTKFISPEDDEKWLREAELEEYRQMGMEKGLKQGIKEGKKLGIEQGIEQNSMAIAREMLKSNEDINKISKYTGLSIEEIYSLKQD